MDLESCRRDERTVADPEAADVQEVNIPEPQQASMSALIKALMNTLVKA
jgi:hypothetical protein